MPSQLTFRAQLVFKEQRKLYDYWCRQAGTCIMPGRQDFNIGNLADLAPSISLLRLDKEISASQFYSAGTRASQIYGETLMGSCLSDCYKADNRQYWINICQHIVQDKRPRVGVVKDNSESLKGFVLFWLRLPLSDNGIGVTDILCHDMPYPIASASSEYTAGQYESRPMAL